MTRYPIREPNAGQIIAYHVRHEAPDGSKRFTWELPDGTVGLNGIKVADLPLFGAAAAHRWDADEPVVVCEGEKDALAVTKAGYQAVGTITGASSCPNREPLMILAGMGVVLWPDADAAGHSHMQKIAAAITDIAAEVAWVTWRQARPGGGAADALAAGGVDLIHELIAAAGEVPSFQPTPAELIDFAAAEDRRKRRRPAPPPHESPIDRFNREVTVSDVLRRDFGLAAVPGRAMRCRWHEDRNPSLSVLPDDRRAFCHSPTCWAHNSGQGRDAWDLAHAALPVAR